MGPLRRLPSPAPLALAVLLAGCATARGRAEAPELRHLRIEGNSAVSDTEIRARIVSEGSSWLPFTAKRYFDEGILETDLRRILRLYQAQGHYKARIVERTVTPADGAVDVLVRVDEGPPTRVIELNVVGLEDVPAELRAELLDGLPLREGDVFKEPAYDALKLQLVERMRERGFAEADVEGSVEVGLAEDAARVEVLARPGQRFRFGRIFVAGADQVARSRIVTEARMAVPEGAPYAESALTLAQDRVFDLGVFAAVRVTRGAPDRREGTVPVVVTVREAPFRTVRLGAGVGLESGRQELPRVTFDWTNRNFFGGLRRLSWENRAAYVFAGNPGGTRNRGFAGASTLTFQQPRIFNRDLALVTSLGYERDIQIGYRSDSANASVGFLSVFNRELSFAPSYNLSLYRLDPSSVEIPRGQEAALDECARRSYCLLAYLEQRLAYDRRDNAVEPRRGYYLSLSLQEGAGALGGNFTYLRLLPEVRGYLPVSRHTLAARLSTGLLWPRDGSSVLTRFFLGGGTSQRGFGVRQLSPRLVLPSDSGSGFEALPVGGNAMVVGNLEARLVLPANLGLVLFVDAGDVGRDVTDLAPGRLQVAVGAGLRYRTVFGPVRLDFGWRINGLDYAERPDSPEIDLSALTPDQLRLLAPSDLSVPRYAIHFSIGEAF